MSSFENLRIVDNFYQTSLFFPMPTVVISTLCEDGSTTLGPYSLVQPYYVAGKDFYAMLLSCRNSSNTAQNILRNGKCALNFITDEKKYFHEAVKLSWPGDTPQEKMPKCNFKLEKSMIEEETGEIRPMVMSDAIQVIECTWVRELDGADKDLPGELNGYEGPYHDFNGITSKFGAHFILRVDKILMKEKYHDAIINGVEYPIFKDPKTDREAGGDNMKKSHKGCCRVFWKSKLDGEITYEDNLTYEESLKNNLMVPIFRDGAFIEGAEVTLQDIRNRLNFNNF